MTFDRPLLALAVSILAIVLLALLDRLRRRPVVLVVASLALFRETAEVATAAARSRRREWRDLLLKCVAACLLALAAGGPSLPRGALAGRHVRIVLARGASMRAREAGGTRFDLARAEVRRLLGASAAEDRIDLHLSPAADDEPRGALSPAEASAALDRVALVDAPHALEARAGILAAAASELARDPEALPAFVVSDEAPSALALAPELKAAARFAVVGTPHPNQGLVALASRRDDEGQERLLVAVQNAGEAMTLGITLRLAATAEDTGGTTLTRSLVLGPDGTGSVLVDDLALGRAGAVFASIPGEHGVGERAIALRATDAPVRIALVGDLGRPLETALRSVPGTEVSVFPLEKTPVRGFDLTVLPWSGESPRQPAGSVVFVAEADQVIESALSYGAIEKWFPATDLVEGLEGVKRVRGAPPAGLEGFERLVWAGESPLLAASAPASGSFFLYVGIPLPRTAQEPWARTVSFPRFWANVVERVRERPDQPGELHAYPTGEPLALPRPSDAEPGERLLVTSPSGHTRLVTGRYVPLEAGIHQVQAEHGKTRVAFAAALLDPRTEDLRRARGVPFTADDLALVARRSASRASASLAWLLALLGLGVAFTAWGLESQAARARGER